MHTLSKNEILTHARVLLVLCRSVRTLLSQRAVTTEEVDAALQLEEIRNTVVTALGLPPFEKLTITGIFPDEQLSMLDECITRLEDVEESASRAADGDATACKDVFAGVASYAHTMLCTPRFDLQRLIDIAFVHRRTETEVRNGYGDPSQPLFD